MTQYHAALRDETGCDFTASVEAKTRQEAFKRLHENYPESRVIDVETVAQIRRREANGSWLQKAYDRDEQDLY
jgi:hypothetical protein